MSNMLFAPISPNERIPMRDEHVHLLLDPVTDATDLDDGEGERGSTGHEREDEQHRPTDDPAEDAVGPKTTRGNDEDQARGEARPAAGST